MIEATVGWSLFTVDLMSESKYARNWQRLNDEVFVELETGQSRMRILVVCGVPGAPSGRREGLPLQMAGRQVRVRTPLEEFLEPHDQRGLRVPRLFDGQRS
ncbi:hypothetical protein [Streptomyces sp. NPDC102283]|uniref:hypothetical protein n=1 Tax=Streptomyces sp. NPDC102283 TaxID=3366155 RepID=UPI00380E037D